MKDPARFWNRASKKYAAKPVTDEATYRFKLAETQARLKADWTIIEIGCGTGNTAIEHASHVAQVRAVDFSADMLAFGRDRAAREGIENVTFEQAALEDIDAAQSYDAVLMLSLLHLLPDWPGAIAKAWALTRPGGIFVSSTACLTAQPLAVRAVLRALRPLGIVPQISVFSVESLRTEIEAQGFDVEQSWQPGPRDAAFIIARRPAG